MGLGFWHRHRTAGFGGSGSGFKANLEIMRSNSSTAMPIAVLEGDPRCGTYSYELRLLLLSDSQTKKKVATPAASKSKPPTFFEHKGARNLLSVLLAHERESIPFDYSLISCQRGEGKNGE